jgi:hypothetical protein
LVSVSFEVISSLAGGPSFLFEPTSNFLFMFNFHHRIQAPYDGGNSFMSSMLSLALAMPIGGKSAAAKWAVHSIEGPIFPSRHNSTFEHPIRDISPRDLLYMLSMAFSSQKCHLAKVLRHPTYQGLFCCCRICYLSTSLCFISSLSRSQLPPEPRK